MTARSHYESDQENFWSGTFGDDYVDRNQGDGWIAANTALFADALRSAPISSVFEIGPNIGLNLAALRILYPGAALAGVEINERAAAMLESKGVEVHRGSLAEFQADKQYDLTLSKGVLIHVNPDLLPRAYDLLYHASRRFVMIAEYYNPRPESLAYRGESDKLFRRDFCGEFLDRYPDVELLRTGFAYHRGAFPQDDLTWFLMEKR